MSEHIPRSQERTDTFFEVWRILLQYRWRFMVTTFAVMIGILTASFFLPRKYEAQALFDRRTDMVMSEIMHRGAPRSIQDPRQSMMNEVAGDPAIDMLIDTLSTQQTEGEFPAGVQLDQLRAQLGYHVLVDFEIATPELDRVKVRYYHENPHVARNVVNSLVEGYIQRTTDAIDQRLREASTFFETQVTDSKNKIELIATRKLNFEIKHGEMLPNTPNSVEAVRTMAEITLDNARQKRDSLKMRVESLADRLAKTPRSTPSVITAKNPEIDRLEVRLRDLEAKEALYAGIYKMTEVHPDLVAVRNEILAVRETINGTEKEVITQRRFSANPMHEEVQLHLANARTDLEAQERQVLVLEERLTKMGSMTADLFPIRAEYERLNREMEDARKQLEFWEDNQRRVDMALRAESGNRGIRLNFVRPCDNIRRPVSPNLAQVLIATISLGFFTGGLSVFLAFRRDTSFQDAQDVQATINLPVFGSVSEIIGAQQRRIRVLKNTVLYPLNAVALAALTIAMAWTLMTSLSRPHTFITHENRGDIREMSLTTTPFDSTVDQSTRRE